MSTEPTQVAKVLVVEDEMILRVRAVDIVEDAGFCSVEAVNADEAIAILESRSDISLLFTDIQMPGSIDGLKLAHAVHERSPSIKIIQGAKRTWPSSHRRPAGLEREIGRRPRIMDADIRPKDGPPRQPTGTNTKRSCFLVSNNRRPP
jgi:CheY-like chemotaxis protein